MVKLILFFLFVISSDIFSQEIEKKEFPLHLGFALLDKDVQKAIQFELLNAQIENPMLTSVTERTEHPPKSVPGTVLDLIFEDDKKSKNSKFVAISVTVRKDGRGIISVPPLRITPHDVSGFDRTWLHSFPKPLSQIAMILLSRKFGIVLEEIMMKHAWLQNQGFLLANIREDLSETQKVRGVTIAFQFDVLPQSEIGSLPSKGLRFLVELYPDEKGTLVIMNVEGAPFTIDTQRLFSPAILKTIEVVNHKVSLGNTVDIPDAELLELCREIAQIFMQRLERESQSISMRDALRDILEKNMRLDSKVVNSALNDQDLFRCLIKSRTQVREWYVNEIAVRLLRNIKNRVKTP